MTNLRDALALGREIAAGRMTAVRALEEAFARIEIRDKEISAWKAINTEKALAEASARDAEEPKGPLHGVPIGVKDVLDTADIPTGYGSSIYEGSIPSADAAAVANLRAAGMVVLGKTVTTEFAMRFPGATRNPHNPAHTPGGSSSGSAAAVADGHVPLAIGTQTSGSVIRPASYCGVVGFKPTWGSVPRAGLKMLAESLDTIGTLANSAADAEAFALALAGRPIKSTNPVSEAPRIGICRTVAWPNIEYAGANALEEAATRAARAGAKILDVQLPEQFATALEDHDIVMTYEACGMLAYERSKHWDRLSPALQDVMRRGMKHDWSVYQSALSNRRACRHGLIQAFQDVDVLLTPSALGEAPEGLGFTGSPDFNRIWTFVGAPSITIPGLKGPNALPVGVQLIAPLGEDSRVIGAAGWLQHLLQS